MQRLFTRTLIGYPEVNGTKFELTPDLATGMGTHNADYTHGPTRLKSGLKFSNGTRSRRGHQVRRRAPFATDVINGGPSSYFTGAHQGAGVLPGPVQER